MKELGIDGLETGTITVRIKETGRSIMEGIESRKGVELQQIFTSEGFKEHAIDNKRRPVTEVDYRKNDTTIYFDVELKQLDKLKAEQERIAAEIARLEGEQHGTA